MTVNTPENSAIQKKKKKARFIGLASVFVVIVLTISFFVFEPIVSKKIHMATGNFGKIVKRYELTTFEIPEGTTTIKEDAFADCTTLKSITIPDSVTTIESYAFSYCTSLTELVIPDSVKFIGTSALEGCDNLETLTLPSVDIIEEDRFRPNSRFCCLFTYTYYNQGGSTGEFYRVSNRLKTIIITNDTVVEGCNSLGFGVKNIILLEGTQSIGDNAFRDSYITSVTIPNGVTSIGKAAFFDTK